MGLKMTHRKAVTSEADKRYRTASKKQKSRILDEHVALTGRNRSYLSWLLRCWGTTVVERRGGEVVRIVVGQRQKRRRSPRLYDEQVVAALKKVWYLFGCLCAKRLVAVLRTQLSVLEKFGELALDPDTRRKLTLISAATIDRLLRTEKRALRIRGRSPTKPTTRLMNEIPIRTFTEWQDARPGEVGADLVGHDGGITGGEHAFTLVLTDRLTQWTEVRAVLNKAQKWVFQALLADSLLAAVRPVRPAHRQRQRVHQPPPAPLLRPAAHRVHPFAPQPQERQQLHRAEEQRRGAPPRRLPAPADRAGGRAAQRALRSAAVAGQLLLPLPEARLQDPPGRAGAAGLRRSADAVSAGAGLPRGVRGPQRPTPASIRHPEPRRAATRGGASTGSVAESGRASAASQSSVPADH